MIQVDSLAPGLKFKLQSMPRGADYPTPITNHCTRPSRELTVDFNGDCFVCSCDGWLPIPVGKVLDFASLDDVFNSPIAKELQSDVGKQQFTFCAVEHCGILTESYTSKFYSLALNIDESCNLACPSCRREQIMLTSGYEYNYKLESVERILDWLDKFDKPIQITFSGNGDACASAVIRPLLKNYKPKSNQTFTLFTNGLLINKVMPDSPLLPQVRQIQISVDAASKEVYENVRRPGKWEVLLENFNWLNANGLSKYVELKFVVQQANYKDIPAFVKLVEQRGYRGSLYGLLNWGTWPDELPVNPDTWTIQNGSFLNHNVLDVAHPEHAECVKILQQINSSNVWINPALEKVIH